jgi:hypothetical protein
MHRCIFEKQQEHGNTTTQDADRLSREYRIMIRMEALRDRYTLRRQGTQPVSKEETNVKTTWAFAALQVLKDSKVRSVPHGTSPIVCPECKLLEAYAG